MGDPRIDAWVNEARKLLGMPSRQEEFLLHAPPDQVLSRLDSGQVEGLTPELQQRLHDSYAAKDLEAAMAQASPKAQAVLRELSEAYAQVQGESVGLLKLSQDPALPPAEMDAVREHLRQLQDLLKAKYDAARAAER
jgi:hypothetical protein